MEIIENVNMTENQRTAYAITLDPAPILVSCGLIVWAN